MTANALLDGETSPSAAVHLRLQRWYRALKARARFGLAVLGAKAVALEDGMILPQSGKSGVTFYLWCTGCGIPLHPCHFTGRLTFGSRCGKRNCENESKNRHKSFHGLLRFEVQGGNARAHRSLWRLRPCAPNSPSRNYAGPTGTNGPQNRRPWPLGSARGGRARPQSPTPLESNPRAPT
jgi:hypothetical protein